MSDATPLSASVAAEVPTETKKPTAMATKWTDVRIYSPPNLGGPSRIPPPLDESPKPTPSELKAAFASHIQQRHGPDAPLMTQAMREREAIRLGTQKKEYNECRIRIRFSDRTQLEATVPSAAQISTLYNMLRAHLDAAHAEAVFTLYQAPPKRDFPEQTKDPKLRGKTLKELGMVPQASLNIRWADAEMNSDTFPAPLSPEVLAQAEDLPLPPVFDPSAPKEEPAADATSGRAPNEQKKMPKWLKGLQKK